MSGKGRSRRKNKKPGSPERTGTDKRMADWLEKRNKKPKPKQQKSSDIQNDDGKEEEKQISTSDPFRKGKRTWEQRHRSVPTFPQNKLTDLEYIRWCIIVAVHWKNFIRTPIQYITTYCNLISDNMKSWIKNFQLKSWEITLYRTVICLGGISLFCFIAYNYIREMLLSVLLFGFICSKLLKLRPMTKFFSWSFFDDLYEQVLKYSEQIDDHNKSQNIYSDIKRVDPAINIYNIGEQSKTVFDRVPWTVVELKNKDLCDLATNIRHCFAHSLYMIDIDDNSLFWDSLNLKGNCDLSEYISWVNLWISCYKQKVKEWKRKNRIVFH
eukprot:533148_1